ncbi:MAG: hypothetical protein K8F24_08830 [Bacteroidales bacterium]|nr:hypothetical protein [Bacteroidales bacterium]
MKKQLLFLIALMFAGASVWAQVTTLNVPGDYATIQAAIDAAKAGDVIQVAAGTYNENVNANIRLTIEGAGSGQTIINGGTGVVLQLVAGDNATERMIVRDLQLTGGTTGLTAGSYTTLENVVSKANTSYGISLNNLTDLLISSCSFNENGAGMKIGSQVSVSHITITDSHFDNNTTHGWYSDANKTTKPDLDFVSITNTSFIGGNTKGFYTERLSNAVFDNITVSDIDNASYAWSAGMDINLKWKAYSDITIKNSSFSNCGNGSTNGVGLTVKARDDGGTYGATPATLSQVNIDNVIFSGNENGLNFGEPGKENSGPAAVEVENCTFTGNATMDLNNFSTADVLAINGNVFAGSTNNFDIEDRVYHKLDNGLKGLVSWVPSNVYVTTNTLGIQQGMNAASSGWTMNVAPGTYTENNIIVNKSIAIRGANYGINPNTSTRAAESILSIAGSPLRAFSIREGNTDVSIDGFSFDGGSPIHDGNYTNTPQTSDVTFRNNIITNSEMIFSGTNTSWKNVIVSDNKFMDVNVGTTSSAMFIQDALSATVTNNVFNNVNYGAILLDDISEVMVSGNTIDVTGAQAIQLAGSIGNATVENNIIAGANSTLQANDRGAIRLYGSGFTGAVLISGNTISGGYNGITIKDGQDISGKDITVTNNSITNLTAGMAAYHGGTGTLNANCNWWGTDDGIAIPVLISGDVDFAPYLLTDDIINPICHGGRQAYNETTGMFYDTAQEAIDAATEGDEIKVYYNPTEELDVNKELNIHYIFNEPAQ